MLKEELYCIDRILHDRSRECISVLTDARLVDLRTRIDQRPYYLAMSFGSSGLESCTPSSTNSVYISAQFDECLQRVQLTVET